MVEYLSKERFLSSMGLTGDETKYGNRDAEHQHRSYSTYMSYEIMDSVEDSIVEEELVPVVHSFWVWVPRNSHYGRKSGEWRCKRCNGIAHGGLSPYCGKCGARMKAKDGDGNG